MVILVCCINSVVGLYCDMLVISCMYPIFEKKNGSKDGLGLYITRAMTQT